MQHKIRLDTMKDIHKFVDIVSRLDEDVLLKDNAGHCVSAKSLMGAIYTMEWADIYCHCNEDISAFILPWII